MTDQYPGWGQPIKVDGKRPEWLGKHDPILYEHRSDERGKFGIGAHWHWKRHDWECVTSIRLPADDPRYRQEGLTEAERRFAAVVADNERLRARVDELLAANNRMVAERRAEAERVEWAHGMIAGQEKVIADLRSDLDGARHENGAAWGIVEQQNKLLAEAAARFREYEKHHDERARAGITKAMNASNKGDWWRQAKVAKESTEKAERNANMAMRLAAAVEPIQTEEEVKIIGIEGGKA